MSYAVFSLTWLLLFACVSIEELCVCVCVCAAKALQLSEAEQYSTVFTQLQVKGQG